MVKSEERHCNDAQNTKWPNVVAQLGVAELEYELAWQRHVPEFEVVQ
jgi:hypothetical protein